jgi:SAM-dependent methyltransferase
LQLSWTGGSAPDLHCPSCSVTGLHGIVLTVAEGRDAGMRLLSCAACGATHFDPMPHPDYGLQPAGGPEALAFYLQQGAGIWSIAANVLPLELPGPRRMLEIGCGFGFGLDIARRMRGWTVQGFDPSPIAAAGAAQLGLPIANRYFTAEQGELAAYDAVACSEVIEHLFRPVEILRLLRSALRPGGVLVLTTPNAGAITPEMTPGILVPLLSIGFHTIIHTAASLERALRAAGFTEVSVEDRGPSLLAHASDAHMNNAHTKNAGRPWRQPNAADRAAYRAYLETAAAEVPVGGDLRLGLLVRAYRESVAAGDADAADRLELPVRAEITGRFGQPPEDLPVGGPVPLEVLAREQPLSLGPLLYAQAMHRRLRGADPQQIQALLGRAARAADRLRESLARIGTDDGDAEDIAWVARSEQLLMAAEMGQSVGPADLDRLGPAPGEATQSAARLEALRRRCFVALVNAGSLPLAAPFLDVVAATEARADRGEALRDEEIDCLFGGAILATNAPPGDAEEGLRLARRLRHAIRRRLDAVPDARAAGLAWPGLTLEEMLLERLGRTTELAEFQAGVLPGLRADPAWPAVPPAAGPSR